MTITLHFGHWWIWVLAIIGGIVVGSVLMYALICGVLMRAIGKGLNL